MGAPKLDELNDLVSHVCDLVSKISGNILAEKQYPMVEARLKKRMFQLKLETPSDYMEYIKQHLHLESGRLVSLLTTHHTFFFREYLHFEYLQEQLEAIIERKKKQNDHTVRIWSAACSRGQEVYSLAMFLDQELKKYPGFNFEIFGSDIDEESVAIAKNGVYHRKEIAEAPMQYLASHWIRGTGEISDFVKSAPSLTSKCSFEVRNLVQLSPPPHKAYDVIFCRNVFIYFDEPTITKITNELSKYLVEGGLFFTGVSESLSHLDISLKATGPSVYSDSSGQQAPTPMQVSPQRAPQVSSTQITPQALRVLCVDDSPSILILLKKVLTKEKGYEVVGTAKNGQEAKDFLDKNTVDLVTLDIHMPVMTGVEYLEKHFHPGHPPVVMISSASRDDQELSFKAIEHGASDFVEKPSLNNLEQQAEEIRNKLKVAYTNRANKTALSSVEKDFAHKERVKNPEKSIILLVGNSVNNDHMIQTFKEYQGHGDVPPTWALFQKCPDAHTKWAPSWEKSNFRPKQSSLNDSINDLWIKDFDEAISELSSSTYKDKDKLIFVYGDCSDATKEKLLNLSKIMLVVEDVGHLSSDLKSVATDCVPFTSFGYLVFKILGDEL